jgi:molecular chaperone Hsp33
MDNCIIKTLAYNKQVRILFMDNTNMVNEICKGKNMNKLLKNALGKTVSIASLMSGILKGNQRVSLKINMSNPKFIIFADADSNGNVRGYLSDALIDASFDEIGNLTIEQLIGKKGSIRVMSDLGMNNIFTGITDMPYRNIVDDFSYYYNQSEQIPTHISLDILFDKNNEVISSRGIFVQLLPGAPANLLNKIKKIISENDSVLSSIENNTTFNELVVTLSDESEFIGIESLQLFCGCSKKILYHILHSLSKDELVDSVQNNKPIETVCNICGTKYSFEPNEIKHLV